MIVMIRRVTSLLMLLLLLLQPLAALGESETPSMADVKFVATSDVALKIRRQPAKSASGVGSVAAGKTIYILSLGAEWATVIDDQTVGYVMTSYLKNVRDYDPATGQAGAEAQPAAEVADTTTAQNTDDFYYGFKTHAVRNAAIYEEQDEKSRFVTKIPLAQELTVSHVDGDWSYAMYQGKKGWVKNSSLFKWDRIDPYAGDIPGCIVYPTMAFLRHSTDILDYDTNVAGKKKEKVHKTVGPGSAICVQLPDEQGRYKTPYWRTTGFVTEDDIAYTIDVVPYVDAQPGDLISVMTTYFGVGKSTLQYQGRNWNIYLATSLLSGTVLQSGEVLNVNGIIGPYRKSTGYKLAPIASPHALAGYGGGTCQVSTTIYNTVIQVPILVNHRKVHSDAGAKYAPKGFDAAVGGGDTNIIFTNTLPYAIRFNFFLSDGVLTCCIFRAE